MKDKPFLPNLLIVPMALVQDKSLQQADRLLYGVVYWYQHLKDGRCFASNETMAEILGTSARVVQNSLTSLEKGGYIRRVYKDAEKRNRLEIQGLLAFGRVSPLGDTQEGYHPGVIDVPPRGDTAYHPGVTRARIGNKNRNKNNLCVPFEEFWKAYPRKVEKKKASAKWDRVPCELHAQILQDLEARAKSDQWMRGFIPHPTTYLNGERWNDEITSKTPARSGQVDRF